MTIEEYFGGWLKVIDNNELIKVINVIKRVEKGRLCPEYSNIFRAFNLCPYDRCVAVFIGQDPYPQPHIATGILFGNKLDTKELSPSLEVIKECCINYEIPHGPIDFDVTLESWAKQGILMLNSALTCEVNKIGSHVNIWRPFITKLLKNLSEKETGLIYVLFGSQAKTFKPYINKNYNNIIETEHPAYYARINQKMPYSVFTNINKLIKENYGTTIKWYQELTNINNINYGEETSESSDFFWPRGL